MLNPAAPKAHPPAKSTGVFAVVRHPRRGNCRFTAFHDTRDAALDVAQRLAAETIEKYGPGEVCYYVIQIVDRVGIIDGKLCQGGE